MVKCVCDSSSCNMRIHMSIVNDRPVMEFVDADGNWHDIVMNKATLHEAILLFRVILGEIEEREIELFNKIKGNSNEIASV